MPITYDSHTGWPSRVESSLRRSISQRTKNAYGFKIGITSYPEWRFKMYGSDYRDMVVVYETSSESHVRDLERWLVDFFYGAPGCDNVNRGGGGPIGQSPFYLYVVRR